MPIWGDGDQPETAGDELQVDAVATTPQANGDDTPFAVHVKRVVAPVRQQVLDQLREAIVTRKLRPGQRLVERELMEQTGVSRPTIREVLRQLAAEGLVASIPNKGTVVASLSNERTRELYEVRAVLESMAVRQFAERATDADRAALRKAFEGLAAAARRDDDGRSLLAHKERFYDALFAGAGNVLVAEIVGGLQTRVTALRSTSLAQSGRPLEMVKEVRAIVDNLEAGDAEAAAAACEYHVMQAARTIFAAVGPNDRDTERE